MPRVSSFFAPKAALLICCVMTSMASLLSMSSNLLQPWCMQAEADEPLRRMQQQLQEKEQELQQLKQQHQQLKQQHQQVQLQLQVQQQRGNTEEEGWNDKSRGWSLIHVFHGTRDHLGPVAKQLKRTEWFSQKRQDVLVSTLLRGKRNGYFVDIAANDAVYLSNSYALETHHDWSGLCIEPNDRYWYGLSHRKCHVVGAVVGTNRENVSFKFSNGEFGGIVGDKFRNKAGGEETRMTVTLLEILQRVEAPRGIDYLSLDVEGAEDLVLGSSVLDEYRFSIMTIERPSEELLSLLFSKDYVVLKHFHRGTETLFVHKEIESDLDKSALDLVVTSEKIS